MLAIVLALGTSVAYGVANFLAPVLMRRHPFAAVLLVGQVAALVGCVALLALSDEATPPLGAVGLAALAGVGNAAGLAGFYEAVRFGPLSVATPIGATSGVLPFLVGVLGGDALGVLPVMGTVLAIGGAALAARRSTAADDEAHWDLPRCVAFAVIAALGLGVLLAALPGAAEGGGLFWALTVQRTVMVLCFVVLVVARGQTFAYSAPVRRRERTVLVVPGVLLLAGTLMYILASDRGQLSVVAVCGSLFPLVTVALAITVLKERVSRTQGAGVVAVVAGVCLIAL